MLSSMRAGRRRAEERAERKYWAWLDKQPVAVQERELAKIRARNEKTLRETKWAGLFLIVVVPVLIWLASVDAEHRRIAAEQACQCCPAPTQRKFQPSP